MLSTSVVCLDVTSTDACFTHTAGRYLKTHQPRQGRKVQQLAAAARAGLGQLAAELGETVAGNLKSTAGNAVLGLVQDGLNAIPGPLGSVSACGTWSAVCRMFRVLGMSECTISKRPG